MNYSSGKMNKGASSSTSTDIMDKNRSLKRSINSVLCASQNNGKKAKIFISIRYSILLLAFRGSETKNVAISNFSHLPINRQDSIVCTNKNLIILCCCLS